MEMRFIPDKMRLGARNAGLTTIERGPTRPSGETLFIPKCSNTQVQYWVHVRVVRHHDRGRDRVQGRIADFGFLRPRRSDTAKRPIARIRRIPPGVALENLFDQLEV
jgi:hypothetical protein